MKNIQVIDGARNAVFSVYAATDEEFAALFPNGTDVLFAEDIRARPDARELDEVFNSLWERPVDKKTAYGIHGTYFADLGDRRECFPSRRETDVTG